MRILEVFRVILVKISNELKEIRVSVASVPNARHHHVSNEDLICDLICDMAKDLHIEPNPDKTRRKN